jgi:hypothetical protein
VAGEDVLRGCPLPEQVERQHRELEAGTALQQQDPERRRQGEKLPHERDRLVVHRLVLGRPVGHLGDRHARSGEIGELVAGALEGRERQRGRAGVEVDRAMGHALLLGLRRWSWYDGRDRPMRQ